MVFHCAMKSKPWITGICTLSLLSFLTGCSTVPRDPALSIGLVRASVTETASLETTMTFTVRIENESPEPIQVEGGVFRFDILGEPLGKGMTQASLEVPALSTATLDVPVYMSHFRMLKRMRDIVEQRRLDYRIRSTIYENLQGRRRTHSLEDSGSIGAEDFQWHAPATPSALP